MAPLYAHMPLPVLGSHTPGRRPRTPGLNRRPCSSLPGVQLRQDAAATAHREVQEGRRSEGVGRCDGSVERSQGPCRGGRQRITVDHGHIDLSLSALVRAECTARDVQTLAAERAANPKGPGLSSVRRDAIHLYYYSLVIG